MRAFIAINLPDDLKQKVDKFVLLLKKELPKLKWVNPESFHLTLKFLGEVDEIEDIKSVLDSVAVNRGRFLIKLSGLNYFPQGGRPRILWLGVTTGSDELSSLAKEIEEKLTNLNQPFKKEGKEFTSHVTLARIKNCVLTSFEKRFIEKFLTYEVGEFIADRVSVMSSILDPSGAIYQEVYSAKFGL